MNCNFISVYHITVTLMEETCSSADDSSVVCMEHRHPPPRPSPVAEATVKMGEKLGKTIELS